MDAIKLSVAILALGLLTGCGAMQEKHGSPDLRWLKDQNERDVCEYKGQIFQKEDCLKITDPTGEKALAEKSAPGRTRTVLCVENIPEALFGGFWKMFTTGENHNSRGKMIARVIDPGDGLPKVTQNDCSPNVARPTVFDKSDPYDEWGGRQRKIEQSYK